MTVKLPTGLQQILRFGLSIVLTYFSTCMVDIKYVVVCEIGICNIPVLLRNALNRDGDR